MWTHSETYSTPACKSFLIGNKNDFNDAFAIAVAANQAHIKSVGVKSVEQQDNQAQHKARSLAIGQRTKQHSSGGKYDSTLNTPANREPLSLMVKP